MTGSNGSGALQRPKVAGKFLAVGDEKLWVRGVTYGAFRPDAEGREYTDLAQIERDFACMASHHLNAVRIPHTLPPVSLLDAATRHGLRVMVGLSAEQSAGYLLDGRGTREIERALREKVRSCAGHPALLCYALGNEIPASMVRWLGARRVERYLERLHGVVKQEDPEGLVTYVNYPTTEYLHLPFLDLVALNVYLESPEAFTRYLGRLQCIAGDRPLLMSELGLDSLRHGEERQAEAVEWQIRHAFAAGCAGAFVFSWTDEWFRAGDPVDEWRFGLTDPERRPKPALAAARRAMISIPYPKDLDWPRISVVVCSYNGSRTLADCCEGLLRLEYPNFEVIVVDDGSSDETGEIARSYGFHVLRTENRGLSSARNTGLEAASGSIVAYLDDDARPDPHWLTYLAAGFMRAEHAAIGGPNIPPPGDGFVAHCVAAAPGGPIHVLLTDDVAEHIPGCNMAFRSEQLRAVGGFDARFRTAGDDVDVCWRLQAQGWTIGFCSAAMVWHHRRNSVRAYYRQQRGYGHAEGLLEQKWPEKYNALGHLTWAGRVYSHGLAALEARRGRVYHGLWGSAPFQPLYQPAPSTLWSLFQMPEWYCVLFALAAVSAFGALWPSLLWWSLPLLLLAAAGPVARATLVAARIPVPDRIRGRRTFAFRALTALLHLIQPAARLRGRLANGLSPLRWHGRLRLAAPWPRVRNLWTQVWRDPLERVAALEAALRAEGVRTRRGDVHDRWDLELRGGLLGSTRLLMAVEDHGAGNQYVRLRCWPRCSRKAVFASLALAGLAAVAWLDRAPAAAIGLLGLAGVLASRTALECMMTTAAALRVAERIQAPKAPPGRVRDLALLRRVALEARPYWRQLAGMVGLSLLATPLALLAPLPLKIAVDNAIGTAPLPELLRRLLPGGAASQPAIALGIAVGLVVVQGLLVYLHSLSLWMLQTSVGERLLLGFRARIFAHLQRLSLSYHDSRGTADSIYRLQYDAAAIQQLAVGGMIPLLTSAITLAALIGVTAGIDGELALVGLAITPSLYLLTRLSRRRLRQRWSQLKDDESLALGVVQEALTALRVVKAFGREEHEGDRFVRRSTATLRGHVALARIEGGFDLLVGLTLASGTAAALYLGVRHVQSGALSLGELFVVMAYLAQLYGPLESISKKVADLQSALASAERAFALLDEPVVVLEESGVRPLVRARGAVEFRQVCFAYQPGHPVLHDVSFSVAAGTRIGIVGTSGAGKTTLMSLLIRFYDPTGGAILLDGIDLREFRVRDLRNQFAIVLQEPVLFSSSIAENIAYGRPTATREEIAAAARAAHAHEFVTRLPEGYATQVGERGMRLSGGERQRIALARAFLKDAPILILDEPTSSVDTATEAVVIDALERLMQNRTTFIIAHRASTVRSCDALLHLELGRVADAAPPGATGPAAGLARPELAGLP